jgi:2,3-bisphosphoglycerate-dependent phosphoglycerate mutase
LLNISDVRINELEIPTGNPLIIDFDDQMEINKYYYLDKQRAKNIIFNQ